MAEWKTVRANIDYHVEIDRHYYSVPYQLAGQQLEARYTATTVEIFQSASALPRIARSSAAYRHTTIPEHMPKSHQAHLEWTPSRLIHWAETIGPATAEVVRTILESKPHPEMGYRACLGIMRLAKTYTNERLEAASQRALQLQACSYSSLHSILKRVAGPTDHPRSGIRTSPARNMKTFAAPLTTIRPRRCCSKSTLQEEQYVEPTYD